MTLSLDQFLKQLQQYHILSPEQMVQLQKRLQGQSPSVDEVVRAMAKSGWITPFQANRLANGKTAELVYGEYVLLERIGKGGMGQVFQARHRLMQQIHALKIIHQDQQNNLETRQRFLREITAIAKLRHDHVIHAITAGEHNKELYLVMEYVPGEDLNHLLKRTGPLDVAMACDLIRQAALGLQHIHEQNMVHRDLKPGNLLLTEEGTIKILDLGLARFQLSPGQKASEGMTGTGRLMGTLDYLAPEQAKDSSRADIRADIYSLGCSLFHLLTGSAPFPGESITDKLLAHRQAPVPDPRKYRPETPLELGKIVQRMMAKQPDERFQTPAEVAAALIPFVPAGDAPTVTIIKGQKDSDIAPKTETVTSPVSPAMSAATNMPQFYWAGGMAMVGILLVGLLVLLFRGPINISQVVNVPEAKPQISLNLGKTVDTNDPTVVIYLNGEKVSADELAKPIPLSPGKHTVVVKRGADILQEKEFRIGDADDGKEIALDSINTAIQKTGSKLQLVRDYTKEGLLHPPFDIAGVGFSSDQRRVYHSGIFSSGSVSAVTVFLWDRSSDQFMGQTNFGNHKTIRAASIGTDGLNLVCSAYFHGPAWFSENKSAKYPLILCRHVDASIVNHSAMSSDNRHFLFSQANTTLVFDLTETIPPPKMPPKVRSDATLQPKYKIQGHLGCFSGDGQNLLTIAEPKLMLWRVDDGQLIREWSGQSGVASLATLSRTGKYAFTSGEDNTMRIWDVATGKEKHYLQGNQSRITAAAFSPDERVLVTGEKQRTLRVWDVATGSELDSRLNASASEINALAFSADGTQFLSAGRADKRLCLWQLVE